MRDMAVRDVECHGLRKAKMPRDRLWSRYAPHADRLMHVESAVIYEVLATPRRFG
jgi:hypothetical protein